MNKVQFIKLYISRLVNSLLPREFSEEYISSLSDELSNKLLDASVEKENFTNVVNKLKSHFENESNWLKVQAILTQLTKFKDLDQICNYLVFLNTLNHPEDDYKPLKIQLPENATMSQLIKPYYQTLDEETILTYIPYTLLGSDSKLFKFHGNSIQIPNEINNSFSSLLKDIFEVALLYKRLCILIEEHKGKFKSTVKTAFVSVIEAQLIKYATDINLIFSFKPDSLLKVYSDIYSWTFQLRFLFRCCKKSVKLEGFEFLTFMYKCTKFDNQVTKLSNDIFKEILKPYYNIMEHWIIKGELVDDVEFFITFDDSQNEFNRIITFDAKKILPIFPKEITIKIFQIGKTLIFLNKYCRELKWVSEYNLKYSSIIFQDNQGLISMSDDEKINLINQQYEEIISYLTLVLYLKDDLFRHLKNLKKFYLMDCNEFVECLMVKGINIFNQNASQISSTYLNKILQESISISSIKNFDARGRLDSRIINNDSIGLGWEVFTIEYRTDDLSISYILFEGQQHLKYLKIFHFLWNLRHLQYLLNQNYILYNQLGKLKYNKVVNTVRYKFIRFINELVNYLSFEIIEESFEKFIVEKIFYNNDLTLDKSFMDLPLKKTEFNVNQYTIDQLINMHEKYLDNIINTKILNGDLKGKKSNQSYIDQIYDLFQVIFDFLNTTKEFHSLAMNYQSLMKNQLVEFQHDLQQAEMELDKLMDRLYKDLYKSRFEPQLYCLKQDLKLDYDLKDLNRML